MNLTGKVALVTGGTRGIGAAAALQLAGAGMDVAITGRRVDEQARSVQQAIEKLGRRCEIIQADAGVPADNRRTVEECSSKLGDPAVLVHSAGGPVNGGLLALKPEDWERGFAVHVHAVFHLCQAAIPKMREKKEGAVILISSTAGIRGIATHIAYQTVKGALPQMTRALAREFAPDNIRVNCVAPGVVRTDFHLAMTEEQRRINLEQRIPLRREGTPDQVADVITMLVKNDFMTGETVVVDGGLTMRIA
jgi:NAD(P)-dependent dehydrogenase (short-subunit alcohol dehydrogenase family)